MCIGFKARLYLPEFSISAVTKADLKSSLNDLVEMKNIHLIPSTQVELLNHYFNVHSHWDFNP